jgi:hypothetical protein
MKIGKSHYCLVLVLLVQFTALSSFGQASADRDSLQYNLDAQIGGQLKRGVFSQTSLRASLKGEVENDKVILNNLSSYTFTEVNEAKIADDWHFRTLMMFKLKSASKLMPTIAHNYLSNLLYRIQNSHRALIGLRYSPFQQNRSIALVLGSGYELSEYGNEIFVNSSLISKERDFGLAFFNLSGAHTLGKLKIQFDYNLSAIQSFKEAMDYSFWLTSSLNLPLRKNLSVGANYDFRFRNVHLQGIPSINDLLMLNIRLKLSK